MSQSHSIRVICFGFFPANFPSARNAFVSVAVVAATTPTSNIRHMELTNKSHRIHLMSAQCVCWPFPSHLLLCPSSFACSSLTILFLPEIFEYVAVEIATTITLRKNILNGLSTPARHWYHSVVVGLAPMWRYCVAHYDPLAVLQPMHIVHVEMLLLTYFPFLRHEEKNLQYPFFQLEIFSSKLDKRLKMFLRWAEAMDENQALAMVMVKMAMPLQWQRPVVGLATSQIDFLFTYFYDIVISFRVFFSSVFAHSIVLVSQSGISIYSVTVCWTMTDDESSFYTRVRENAWWQMQLKLWTRIIHHFHRLKLKLNEECTEQFNLGCKRVKQAFAIKMMNGRVQTHFMWTHINIKNITLV